jgi:hypothetical protein
MEYSYPTVGTTCGVSYSTTSDTVEQPLVNCTEIDPDESKPREDAAVTPPESKPVSVDDFNIYHAQSLFEDPNKFGIEMRQDFQLFPSIYNWELLDTTVDYWQLPHPSTNHDQFIYSFHEHADTRDDQTRNFLCSSEDDMHSLFSNDHRSLFDSSPSEYDTATTTGSSTIQQGHTHTNIEHMLAVLITERTKCLKELQGFDAALKTIDQMTNRKGSESELGLIKYV